METKKAALYIRVSTNNQENSVLAQTDRLRSYCKFNNIEIVKILEDQDVSGGMEIYKRPSGSEIQALVKNKEINCVIATNLDRLFRSTLDALITVDKWDKENIGLHFADSGGVSFDCSTANGRLFFTMQASMATYERAKTSERIKEVSDHKKKNMKTYGPAPLGFDIVGRELDKDGKVLSGGSLIPNEKEQEVVREIFNLRSRKMSMGKIADRLNKNGVSTKNNAEYHASTIKHILDNNIYKK